MYQPAHARFIEQRGNELRDFIREYPLGALVTSTEHGIDANHIPFLIDDSTPAKLTAHVPRTNPVWRAIDSKQVLVIFQGPNAYISPSWYAAKRLHGKAVPTWNYAVAHAQGIARAIDDKTWIRAHLEEMTTVHESRFASPWKIGDAPSDYIDSLLGALIGVEISVTKLDGKFKLGQNRSAEDQQSVIEGLSDRGPLANELAKFSARRRT